MPNGSRSIGDRAEILPVLCEVYLGARHEGVTVPSQLPAAKAGEILIRGLARVGIIALVYEATGYQEVRARYELQATLMRIARNGQEFEDLFERAFQPPNQRFPLVIDVPDTDPTSGSNE